MVITLKNEKKDEPVKYHKKVWVFQRKGVTLRP